MKTKFTFFLMTFLLTLSAQSFSQVSFNRYTFSGMAAVPMGDFASTSSTSNSAGFAKAGYGLRFDATSPINDQFFWHSSIALNGNAMDKTELANQFRSLTGINVSIDANDYLSLWILSGVAVHFKDMPVYLFAQIGGVKTLFPDLTISSGTASVKTETTSNYAFAYSLGLGYKIQNVELGIRYNAGKPDFEQKSSSSKNNFSMPVNILSISAGYGF